MKTIFCNAFCVAVVAGVLAARPAVAQPVLERLEKAIREKAEQPGAAGAAAPAAPAAVPDREAGYLGAVLDDRNDRGRGVRVTEVRPDAPAAKAGLKTGDLITAVGGVRVREMSSLADVMALFKPGDTVALDLQRDNQPQQVKVTLGRRAAVAGAPADSPGHPVPAAPRPTPPPVAPAAPPAVPIEPPLEGPRLEPPKPAADAALIEQLRQRIEQLERRVAELEKAQAEKAKEPGTR